MKLIYKNLIFFYIPIAWFFYSFFVFSVGNCDLEMKMTKNGKYDIVYTITEDDIGDGYYSTYEYEKIYTESLNLNEAEKIINDCIKESEKFMKKYGTVYNLKTGDFTLDVILWFFYFIVPYVFIYIFYKK